MDFLCLFVVGCLSLQAKSEPPAPPVSTIAYSEHSSLIEYVVATHFVEDDDILAALAVPSQRAFEGYWLDDPITTATIDEYNVVGTVSPVPLPKPLASSTTFRRTHGDGRSAAARAAKKAARKRPSHALTPETRRAPRDHALRAADHRVGANHVKLE
jgi:hypothetical protein